MYCTSIIREDPKIEKKNYVIGIDNNINKIQYKYNSAQKRELPVVIAMTYSSRLKKNYCTCRTVLTEQLLLLKNTLSPVLSPRPIIFFFCYIDNTGRAAILIYRIFSPLHLSSIIYIHYVLLVRSPIPVDTIFHTATRFLQINGTDIR